MKVIVTPECQHADGWHSSGIPLIGQHAVISREGVWLDGESVIRRDHRTIKNRQPGHPWLTSNGYPDPSFRWIGWTTFNVRVEP